jgi:peptidoglycan/xylan/chitin deacetylase (PgdA/CDA1 family)
VTRAAVPLVLCYHGVSDSVEHDLFVRPGPLIDQVRLMLRLGYRPATAEATLAGRGRLLHVSFDDAFRSITLVLPELRRLGVPVTVFACTDLTDSGVLDVPELAATRALHPEALSVMGWSELRELAQEGVTIGSHTRTHPHLTRLSDAALDSELGDSRQRLEDELRAPCDLFAYPYGERDARVQAATARAGYRAAFALRAPVRPLDPYAVPRVDLYRGHGRLHAVLKTATRRARG